MEIREYLGQALRNPRIYEELRGLGHSDAQIPLWITREALTPPIGGLTPPVGATSTSLEAPPPSEFPPPRDRVFHEGEGGGAGVEGGEAGPVELRGRTSAPLRGPNIIQLPDGTLLEAHPDEATGGVKYVRVDPRKGFDGGARATGGAARDMKIAHGASVSYSGL